MTVMSQFRLNFHSIQPQLPLFSLPHLPLLRVHAHVGVVAHGEQPRQQVQVGVGGAEEVEADGREAVLGEAGVGQQLPQLLLGVGRSAEGGEVQACD